MTATCNSTLSVIFCRSNPIEPDPRVEKAADCLAKAGYSVTLLGWDRTGRSARHETKNNIEYNRIFLSAPYGAGMRNLIRLIQWQVLLLKWLVQSRDHFDVVHACDFDTVVPALLMKWFYKKAVIYDIFDFYADHFRTKSKNLRNIVRFVDNRVVNSVDGVILADDSRVDQIGGKPKLLITINNSPPDISEILELGDSSIESSDNFNIVFVGILQRDRGLSQLFALLEKHPDWCLDIAGFGADVGFVTEESNKLNNVTWHGRIDYPKALKLSADADTLIALYDPKVPNHQFASPNKIFEAMMLSKPIVVAKNTGMDTLVTQHNNGVAVDYNNPNELEAALTQLADNSQTREQLGMNGRQAYETQYSWSVMEDRLLGFYADAYTRPVRH